MYEFKLPDLGEGVHEGEILEWHVKLGDVIKEDDPLVEVETDKAAVTIPSPRAGEVVSVTGGVGDTIAVGSVIVVIDDGGAPAKASAPKAVEAPAPAPVAAAPAPAPVAAAPAPAPVVVAQAPVVPIVAAAVAPKNGGPVPAAPATRRLARELGVDLRSVPASGPAGRVTADDVRRFADAGGNGAAAAPAASGPVAAVPDLRPAAPRGPQPAIPFFDLEPVPDFAALGPIEREPVRSIRRKVARKMTTSMIVVPHVAHMDEADVTDLDAFRRAAQAERGDDAGGKLTMLAFVMKAVVAQLRKAKNVNASIDPAREEIVYKGYYNIGFAADTPKGLVVPVVHGADKLSIAEMADAISSKAERARAGKLDVAEMRGGTFTITNVGSLGGTGVIPTINYPEVAILGMGRARLKAVVRDGEIVPRLMLPMTLAYDHRIIDGADGARFMTAIVRKLSNPNLLLIES